MALYQCNACGGTFRTPDKQGVVYFHACPPLSVNELLELTAAGKVQVDDVTAGILADARRADDADPVVAAKGQRARADSALRNIARPGHVDQNLRSTRAIDDPDNPFPPVSLGAGVTQIGD